MPPGAVRDELRGAHHVDARLAELRPVRGRIEAVSGEAVELVDVEAVEPAPAGVRDHAQELGAPVGRAADRVVGVHRDHRAAVRGGLRAAHAHLVVYGLLALVVG